VKLVTLERKHAVKENGPTDVLTENTLQKNQRQWSVVMYNI
jgi:hypothetical protein